MNVFCSIVAQCQLPLRQHQHQLLQWDVSVCSIVIWLSRYTFLKSFLLWMDFERHIQRNHQKGKEKT